MLKPLKRAHWLAELGAQLGVFHGLSQHGIGQPDQLCRAHQRTKIQQVWIVAGLGGHCGQLAERIDAGDCRTCAVGHPRIDGVRRGQLAHSGYHGVQVIGLALCDEPRHTNEGRIDQRFGKAGTATFRGDQGGFDQPHA
ncbi:MAG: hypothetical protein RIQ99_1181 [Pseudomonadota bacterium]